MIARPDGDRRGFLLFEAIIALAIASIALAAVIAAVGAGLNNLKLSRQYDEALLVAQSQLETVGKTNPLATGETTGEGPGAFRWRIDIEQTEESTAGNSQHPATPAIFDVKVTVYWQVVGKWRNVSLWSERLGAPSS